MSTPARSANFHVSANGVQLNPPSASSPDGVWSSNPQAVTYAPGANTVTIALNWDDNDTSHFYLSPGNNCKNGNNNPCSYSGTQPAHQTFVGTKANSGAVVVVNNSFDQATATGSVFEPGTPFDNHRSGGEPSQCNGRDTCDVFPTVGTESVLTTGVYTTLRLDDPQSNQTLQCDPAYAQGQEFSTFQYGCEPWYTANKWKPNWWVNKQCPDSGQWFSYATTPLFGKNGAHQRLAVRPYGTGHVHGSGRGRHRGRDRELQQHQQQLVPAVRLQLPRQLRRQARSEPPGWLAP